MENKLEKTLVIAKKPKKENPMSRIVVENFGDWNNFRKILEDARESIDYDPLENRFSQRRFIREILQSNAGKISADDFKKLSNLITKEISTLKRREGKATIKKEKEKSAKEKYVQREMPFGDGKEKIRFKSRDKNLSKNIDKILYH